MRRPYGQRGGSNAPAYQQPTTTPYTPYLGVGGYGRDEDRMLYVEDVNGQIVTVPQSSMMNPLANPNAMIDTLGHMLWVWRKRKLRSTFILFLAFIGSIFSIAFLTSMAGLLRGTMEPISWRQVTDKGSATQVGYWAASQVFPIARGTTQLVVNTAADSAPVVQYVDSQGGVIQSGQSGGQLPANSNVTPVMYISAPGNLGGQR